VLTLILTVHPAAHWRQLYELAAVMLAFPAILLVAMRCEPGRISAPVFAWLGAASYAVYVLHHPLGVLAGEVMDQLPGQHSATLATGAAFLLATVVLATLADKVYDTLVRRRLTEALRNWPAPPHARSRGPVRAGQLESSLPEPPSAPI
jgi:peptidoglycan/LPS O-acetylase OafA/YrhL